ncbi:MAG: PspC domain-containing protein [Chitinophagaceae bacterium]|nr:PspC domain-containing protein [Chitinophagaceae bacterium]
MKKVININFQGRVIPIEDSAYEILKQYVESLRHYFEREEGREEIINDIENRIAELFEEKIKKGTACITDADLQAVMGSMGRPEDFEQEEIAFNSEKSANSGAGQSTQSSASDDNTAPRKLFRAENDKVLGGVCAGLAIYFKIDPAIVRIIFALIAFGGLGFGFLLYIILWIIIPSRPLQLNVRKRLYRDPDNKMIGGVAGGLAAYFNVDTWIPRLIFLVPFILSVMPNIFNGIWWHWGGPWFAFSGLGGTFFFTYIILWIVLPSAVTASEKLEMRGEKIDLESIKHTVQEELQNIKGRAEKAAGEFQEKAKEMGREISDTIRQKSQSFSAEAAPLARKTGTGIGHAIGVLFKAFFLFIAGIIAFSLLIVLIGLVYVGFGLFPLNAFLLDSVWGNLLAWSVLTLFLGVPIIAFIVWLFKRLLRIKSSRPYLGYAFASLWIIGLISVFLLIANVSGHFRAETDVSEQFPVAQPSSDNLIVKLSQHKVGYYSSDWFNGFGPLMSMNQDSMLLNNVKIKLIKSPDSLYHIETVKLSKGKTPFIAEHNASLIQFPLIQNDSVITLPKGFSITNKEKFRNQKVMVVIEIPVGKKILIDHSINWFDWFNLEVGSRRIRNRDTDEKWNNGYSWRTNILYIMTNDGLRKIDTSSVNEVEQQKSGKYTRLRYRSPKDKTHAGNSMKPDSSPSPNTLKRREEVLSPAPVENASSRISLHTNTVKAIKSNLMQHLYSPFHFLTGLQ